MVKVKVNQGMLEGESLKNDYGGAYFSFKGIPYAEPPIGDLRFKAPNPPKSWEGIRSAKEFGPVCIQFNALTGILQGSEDCLYLNVYTPDLRPVRPLPVMVWIHGGAFTSGNGNDDVYGPEFLIRHDVIIVTFNYRLEVLGFLCLDTEDIPGNAGMKDQVAALRWVKNNIRNFGGDPGNITLFGESAGAASVSFHLVSPMSKGLFKRAIAQSGSANNWLAQSNKPRERALKMAKHYGVDTNNDKQIYDFFKSAPLEWLIKKELPITTIESTKECLQLYFAIANEKKFGNNERFFYGDINDAIRNNIHDGVEIIIGYTEDEGVFGFLNQNPEKIINQINNFTDYLVPIQIVLNCGLTAQLEIGKKFKKHYFGNEEVTHEHMGSLIKYFTLQMFAFEIIEWAKICSKKNTVYLYQFGCKSERNFFATLLRVNHVVNNKVVTCHGDDLAYLFPVKIMNQKVDKLSDTFKYIDNITKLWTNFAKYGNPTPDDALGVRWVPYCVENQMYLNISNQLKMDKEPNKEDVEFWEQCFREYLPQYIYNK